MPSPRSGDAVVNQFEIITDDGRYFQSYDKMIAFVNNDDVIHLDLDFYKFSSTTSTYLYRFLGLGARALQQKINNGQVQLLYMNGQEDIRNVQ